MSKFADRVFNGYVEFYEDVYPDAIVQILPAGRTGASLMRLQQEAGDWSDAATPDLIILRPKTFGISATLDFGAGRFRTHCPLHSFTVVAPLVATSVLVEAAHGLEVYGVPYSRLVDLAGADIGLPADGDFGSVHGRMHEDIEVGMLFDRLFKEMETGSARGALYADSILLHLTARLLEIRDGTLPRPSEAARGGLAPWQVKRVCEAMIAAMNAGEQEASLAELALIVGLSANHFCRGFARSLGLPPHRWMAERRMERAAVLLSGRSLSLTDIALALGYTSQSAFGRAFVRIMGMTPSAWRRARRT